MYKAFVIFLHRPVLLLAQISYLLVCAFCEESSSIATSIKTFNKTIIAENILSEVIPEDSFGLMKIRYRRTQIEAGAKCDGLLVRKTPDFIIWPYEEGCLYTLIVIGPDAPSEKHREHSEYQHWIKVNIPECEIHKGSLLTAYVGDVPTYDFGLHKMIYMAFKQPSKEPIEFDEEFLPRRPIGMKRIKFSTKNFTKKYNLGLPVAGNYFVMNVGVKMGNRRVSGLIAQG